LAAMRLIRQLRERLRTRHYSRRTEEAYVRWVKRRPIGSVAALRDKRRISR